MRDALSRAAAGLGDGPLTEASLSQHVFPLFSKVLRSNGVYLANHSLGRPLDQTPADIAEGVALWPARLGDAWDGWLAEREAHRARIASLIGGPRADCVIPKTSAGQGLRAVLNALPGTPRVVATRDEFDSIDVILRRYAQLGRIQAAWVAPRENDGYETGDLLKAIDEGADLVVVSHVLFTTGQILPVEEIAAACRRQGARLLVDAYHSAGAMPVDAAGLGIDFLIGGCYKYLRGGPGACFLYVSPSNLEGQLQPIDIGWFAKQEPFRYERPDPPALAAGGDAFLESTPPVLTYYQARAGQRFALQMGTARLREYSFDRLNRLKQHLAGEGVNSYGGDAGHGAFLTVRNADATTLASRLAERGIIADARGDRLRMAPDCLTRDDELRRAARTLGQLLRGN